MKSFTTSKNYFNPRSPHGERRTPNVQTSPRLRFQSTLPTRGATRNDGAVRAVVLISIHAPHTGSDPGRSAPALWPAYFNPRSPHGERPTASTARSFRCLFQSTLPTRGATWFTPFLMKRSRFQSTLPTRGATCRKWRESLGTIISIHAPHTGSDYVGNLHEQR